MRESLLAWWACDDGSMAAEEIDVDVARAMWDVGDLVVDVRTPDEYAHGHIAGSVNIPLDRIAVRAAELPPGQVVAVCSMGNRSRRGAEAFARTGRDAFRCAVVRRRGQGRGCRW